MLGERSQTREATRLRSHLGDMSRTGTSTETESGFVVARGWGGEWGMGWGMTAALHGVSLGVTECSGISGDGCTTPCVYLNVTEFYILIWLK